MIKSLIIGNGKVGSALSELIRKKYDVTIYDLDAETVKASEFDVLHICYPYFVKDFVGTTLSYIKKFNPHLTIIESTVKVGTTNQIFVKSPKSLIVHSPIRGQHDDLLFWIKKYTKFIGPTSKRAGLLAKKYYEHLELKTYLAHSSLETESAKILNLSYYACQIAFFQEVKRKAKLYGLNYSDVLQFFNTMTNDSEGRFPRPIFKGNFIGGTCVIYGMNLLFSDSKFADWINSSNGKVKDEQV